MNQQETKNLSEKIIKAIIDLNYLNETKLYSDEMMEIIAKHPKYEDMKNLYIDFLNNSDCKYDTELEIRKLTDFRCKIEGIFLTE
jgi:hypothetical protein